MFLINFLVTKLIPDLPVELGMSTNKEQVLFSQFPFFFLALYCC